MKNLKLVAIGCLLLQGIVQASDENTKPLTLSEKAILHRNSILMGVAPWCIITPMIIDRFSNQSGTAAAFWLAVGCAAGVTSFGAGYVADRINKDKAVEYYKQLPNGTVIQYGLFNQTKEIRDGKIDNKEIYYWLISNNELKKPNIARDRFVVEQVKQQYLLAGDKVQEHGRQVMQSWNKFCGGTLKSGE